MLALILALQAAPAAPLPDLQIGVRVQARELRIERQGEARLEVRAEPDAGSRVTSAAPRAEGRRVLRDIDVRVDAEARIKPPETGAAPPR